jgi:hypothetical protein
LTGENSLEAVEILQCYTLLEPRISLSHPVDCASPIGPRHQAICLIRLQAVKSLSHSIEVIAIPCIEHSCGTVEVEDAIGWRNIRLVVRGCAVLLSSIFLLDRKRSGLVYP